jgi:hypothetical protein
MPELALSLRAFDAHGPASVAPGGDHTARAHLSTVRVFSQPHGVGAPISVQKLNRRIETFMRSPIPIRIVSTLEPP